MASWLRTTGDVKHTTKLPAGISPDKAIEALHNHVSFLTKCDPHMIKYEPIPRPSDAVDPLPDRCSGEATGEPKFFAVTDRVHKLPAGLWDSDVVSTYELVDLKKGLFMRLRTQLGIVMETVFDIGEDEVGGLTLRENVVIKASRLLLGIVKSMCENDWRIVHGSLVEMMSGGET